MALNTTYIGYVSTVDRSANSDSPVSAANALLQNFPNPFNPATTIEYAVMVESPVEISVFDVHGCRIATLVDENKSPGRYHVVWDGRNERGEMVASGMYLYRLTVGEFDSVRKMLVIR
jgi:hypothetical protein